MDIEEILSKTGLFGRKTDKQLIKELQLWRIKAINLISERLTDKEKQWIEQSKIEPYKYIDSMVALKSTTYDNHVNMKEEFSLPGIPEEYEITIDSYHDTGDPKENCCLHYKKVRHIPTDLGVGYLMDYENMKFSKENESFHLMGLKKAILKMAPTPSSDWKMSYFQLSR